MFGRGPFNLSSATVKQGADQETMIRFWKVFKQEVPDAVLNVRGTRFEKRKQRHHTATYKVGDHIMWKFPKRLKGQLVDRYHGPFQVFSNCWNDLFLAASWR
jgi:hypothetical protein